MLDTVFATQNFKIDIMAGDNPRDYITLFIKNKKGITIPYNESFLGTEEYFHVPAPNFWERWVGITWEDKVALGIQKLEKVVCKLEADQLINNPVDIAEGQKVAYKFANDFTK